MNVDYASLATELQSKIAAESDLLSAGFPDQTIVLLSNVLAGITAMLNYSQVTRDLNNFTPFAFLKSAGYAIASTLGVSPARKRGAQQTVSFVSGDNQPDFSSQLDVPLTVPAYTQFACRSMIFHTREDYVINPTDLSVEFQLYEGSVTSTKFISNGEKYQRWLLGTQYSVDENTVRVLIANQWWTSGNGTFVKYLANDQVFIPTTSPDGRVLILFGNGTYGVVPSSGSTINVYYTITLGSQGNSASVGDPVFLMDIVSISPGTALGLIGNTTTVASGGMDEDDLDSIKYVTPRLYASNERSVRRDDYIGQLLSAECPVAMMDARAWGEYEQAQLVGLGTVEMMNRAFWGGVLATMQAYSNSLGQGDGVTTRFSLTLYHPDNQTGPNPFVILGSLQIYSTDPASASVVFSDLDGYGILTSPLISRDYLRTSGVTADSPDPSPGVGNVIDGSPDSLWQSSSGKPVDGNPIFIRITLPTAQVPASYRIRASNDLNADNRAFPSSISVWGSNQNNPSALDQTLWIPVRGNVYPDDPGVEGYSRWYSLDNTMAYKYLLFQINDSYGVNPWVKLSEIEVQILPQSSTINYQTAQVVIDYGSGIVPPLAIGTNFIAQFYADDLTPEQQATVQNFILDTNHFTTQFTFSSVRMVRADLNLRVYYNPAYSRNTILNNVSKALQNLLQVRKGSISKSRKFSDLTGAVTSVLGVDYCVFINPPNGQDIDCEIDQYVYMTSLTIEMLLSDRM